MLGRDIVLASRGGANMISITPESFSLFGIFYTYVFWQCSWQEEKAK